MNTNTTLTMTIYQTIWLAIVGAAIIAACSWADTGAKDPERTPKWSLFDEKWDGGAK